MDGGQDGCLDQPGVSQSHEVIVAVDEIEFARVLEGFGDVKVFGHFGIDGGILFVPLVHYGMQASAGNGIPGGEQRHVPATGDEAFGDVASDRFPSTVLARRRTPGYGRKDSQSFVYLGHNRAITREWKSDLVSGRDSRFRLGQRRRMATMKGSAWV